MAVQESSMVHGPNWLNCPHLTGVDKRHGACSPGKACILTTMLEVRAHNVCLCDDFDIYLLFIKIKTLIL